MFRSAGDEAAIVGELARLQRRFRDKLSDEEREADGANFAMYLRPFGALRCWDIHFGMDRLARKGVQLHLCGCCVGGVSASLVNARLMSHTSRVVGHVPLLAVNSILPHLMFWQHTMSAVSGITFNKVRLLPHTCTQASP